MAGVKRASSLEISQVSLNLEQLGLSTFQHFCLDSLQIQGSFLLVFRPQTVVFICEEYYDELNV